MAINKQAVKAIILRTNPDTQKVEVLLQKYLAAPNPEKALNKMALPGGKLDEGDTFKTALQREVEEETGVLVELRKQLPETFSFSYTNRDGDLVNIVASVFTAEVLDMQGIFTEPTEEANTTISAPFWIALDEINFDEVIFDEAPFLEEVRNNTSEYFMDG